MPLPVLFTALLICVTLSGHSQNCDAALNTYKGWSSRSITPVDGTNFQMELTNKQSEPLVFELKAIAGDNDCTPDETANTGSLLNTRISYQGKDISKIMVPANSTTSFILSVSKGTATRLNSWYCLEVAASSLACTQRYSNKLKVYLSDGKDY